MSRSAPGRAFAALTRESLRDALRRRTALAIAAVLTLAVLAARSCTDFGPGDIVWNGEPVDPRLVASWLAPFLVGSEALALVIAAAVLACDHLAAPLVDGTAAGWLARPVGRGVYAAARLAGVVALAALAGAVLLGATTGFLALRHGLPLGPALVGAAAALAGAVAFAALAMTASLALGRTALLLVIGAGIPAITAANLAVFVGGLVDPVAASSGVAAAVTRLTPPIGLALVAALAPWTGALELANPHYALGRLVLWAAAALGLLLVAFRRVEIEA